MDQLNVAFRRGVYNCLWARRSKCFFSIFFWLGMMSGCYYRTLTLIQFSIEVAFSWWSDNFVIYTNIQPKPLLYRYYYYMCSCRYTFCYHNLMLIETFIVWIYCYYCCGFLFNARGNIKWKWKECYTYYIYMYIPTDGCYNPMRLGAFISFLIIFWVRNSVCCSRPVK